MGKFAVTQEQYEAVVGTNPSMFKGKNKNPVESVTWIEAVAFCDKLTKQAGPAKSAFVLPSEAQWEYACRAGTKTEYYFGDDEKELDRYAWFEKNAGYSGTQPMGLKPANSFGLFDMHGNVWQWCQDWFDENYYKNSSKVDPTGPKERVIGKILSIEARVLRGGSFRNKADWCRAAFRFWYAPDRSNNNFGFRVVLSVDY